MLSTPAGGGEEVRWLLLAVHVDLGLKKRGGEGGWQGWCPGTGTAGLYSRAHPHRDGHYMSGVILFLHCAILPPSSTFQCSCPWVSNPCKKKDCQEENQIKLIKAKKKNRKEKQQHM